MKKIILIGLMGFSAFAPASAKENTNSSRLSGTVPAPVVMATCTRSVAKTEMSINNVRTLILIQSDMWWATNASPAVYEIPKGSGKHSLFAGALWIGGIDGGSNLHVAAQTYRQSGDDFWPGPLDITTTSISQSECNKYDRHFKIHRSEVEDFIANSGTPGYTIPAVIKDWPGNGDPMQNQGHFLAPFYDNNADGLYNADDGDFPLYYFEKLLTGNASADPCSKDILLGDETLWWVFNDVGNVHGETNSISPIGLEIRAQAFAFATNDEINNMTFYRYQIINRNISATLNNCYFGTWVDADLGWYLDDYVGCDVARGFGYCYNGDEDDEGGAGYGKNPPAVGMDFFQGPLADVGDGIDNNRDNCIDGTSITLANGTKICVPEDNVVMTKEGTPKVGYYLLGPDDTIDVREQIIMAKFVYYDNNFSPYGNPVTATHYYNYLNGLWRNGVQMTFGGTGHGDGTGTGATTTPTNFMFPGTSDPDGWGTNGLITNTPWDENIAGNPPDDRRFLQSAGPFTLKPGAVNYITTGVPWARGNSGVQSSIALLLQADDFAQALFDNCFRIVNGPDAPDLAIRELDKELILTLTTLNPLSNNYKETYAERDPSTAVTTFFRLEGYQIFQLRDETVSSTDLTNPDKARLVKQVDIKNGVKKIVNFSFDPNVNAWNAFVAVDGEDKGLAHTFRVTQDLFASGNNTLVNHKTYYYMVLAYAYNPAEITSDPVNDPAGRNKPYLAGRKNVKLYSAIPHFVAPELGGVVLNSKFGDGPEITKIEGKGNGHQPASDRLALNFKSTDDINADQVAELLTPPYVIKTPTYAAGRGPVDIRVYDPLKVVSADFELWERMTTTDTTWMLKNLNTGAIDSSDKTWWTPNDEIFPKYGFSVNMAQTNPIGSPDVIANGGGFIEAGVIYKNPGRPWLQGIPDIDEPAPSGPMVATRDWIASGKTATDYSYGDGSTAIVYDADQVWEKVIGGTWAPFKFVRVNNSGTHPHAPGFNGISAGWNIESELPSVDIVFTSDKSKWSKCVVIEEQSVPAKAVGTQRMGYIRRSPSLDINGNVTGIDSGFSYFPGYAVDLGTGERLNIAFGEDSYYQPGNGFAGQTGADMKWNPTSTLLSGNPNFPGETFSIFGGKHVIYVFGHVNNPVDPSRNMTAYDEGQLLHSKLKAFPVQITPARAVWSSCMWVGNVMLRPGESLLSNDVRVRIRVSSPYAKYLPPNAVATNDSLPKYRFSTAGLVAKKGDVTAARTALDLINVVPNPYYAHSSYEKNQLDNRVKIVNLPTRCVVKIFSPSGMLVRKLNRDVSGLSPSSGYEGTSDGAYYPNQNLETSLDWDLKNQAGIPVASGVYLIHVDAPGVGEKTIKLFAVLRPVDLDTF